MSDIIKYEDVESKVIVIRNEHVLIDRDVAALYGVETRRVNEAVARNLDKFPDGYIFVLDKNEKEEVVANCDNLGAIKFSPVLPTAFTERGLYMLATILKSPVATQTTIAIIEAFTNLRNLNRTFKQLVENEDEDKQGSLIRRVGNAYVKIFDDELMEVKGDESSMEVNLPFFKLKHTVKREKRKEK